MDEEEIKTRAQELTQRVETIAATVEMLTSKLDNALAVMVEAGATVQENEAPAEQEPDDFCTTSFDDLDFTIKED